MNARMLILADLCYAGSLSLVLEDSSSITKSLNLRKGRKVRHRIILILHLILLWTMLHSDSDTQISLLRVFQDVASAWKQCLRVKDTIAHP